MDTLDSWTRGLRKIHQLQKITLHVDSFISKPLRQTNFGIPAVRKWLRWITLSFRSLTAFGFLRILPIVINSASDKNGNISKLDNIEYAAASLAYR